MALAAADPLQWCVWESKGRAEILRQAKGWQTSAACGVYSRDTQIQNHQEDVVNDAVQHVGRGSGDHLRPDDSLRAGARNCLKSLNDVMSSSNVGSHWWPLELDR